MKVRTALQRNIDFLLGLGYVVFFLLVYTFPVFNLHYKDSKSALIAMLFPPAILIMVVIRYFQPRKMYNVFVDMYFGDELREEVQTQKDKILTDVFGWCFVLLPVFLGSFVWGKYISNDFDTHRWILIGIACPVVTFFVIRKVVEYYETKLAYVFWTLVIFFMTWWTVEELFNLIELVLERPSVMKYPFN